MGRVYGGALTPGPLVWRAARAARPVEPGRMRGMLLAASTIKDTAPHVRRFVEGNLAGGLDHLVVFLDHPGGAGQAEVLDYLEAHPHVTAVRAGRGWWAGARPHELNERQCTNANVARQVLREAGLDGWLFHVDGDEVARVDRDVLDAVPRTTSAVRLVVREAVSRVRWDGEPTAFKRELDDGDLALLATLGVIDEASNRDYFHGHLQGKSGVRLAADAWLTLHKAVDATGAAVETHHDERLELFHYESYSGADFVRKWTAMVEAGPRASFRPGRARTARALRALITKDLPADVLEDYLLRVFRATTEDDETTLRELGLLLETDPLAGQHRPREIDEAARRALAQGFEQWRERPKSELFRGTSARTAGEEPAPTRPSRRRRILGS